MVFKSKMESVKQVKKDILKEVGAEIDNSGMEFAPLRSLDDFLMESARFQLPQTRDLERWNNRIVHNLLYYQTNYFVLAIIIFLIVGMLHPVQMMYGILAISLAFLLFTYVTSKQSEAVGFKRDHPIVSILCIFALGYACVYLLGSVVVFLCGITFPLALIFLHASLRMRSLKNKITRWKEEVGFQHTPMGIVLDWLGQTDRMLMITKRAPSLSD